MMKMSRTDQFHGSFRRFDLPLPRLLLEGRRLLGSKNTGLTQLGAVWGAAGAVLGCLRVVGRVLGAGGRC